MHIYYIRGRLPSDLSFSEDSFIGNWEEDEFSFLFFSRPADALVSQVVRSQPQLTLIDEYTISYEAWLGEKPGPRTIGRFLITPPCRRLGPPEGIVPIIIDPGVVFGTGTHPTTRDCLEAIDYAFAAAKFDSAVDLGTGTGLLAIAAAKLGCVKVLAIDSNHLAAVTAGRNVSLNDLEDRVMVVQGKAEAFPAKPADLVMANIHYDVMKRVLRSGILSRNSYFILSGLFRSQAKTIAETAILRRADIIKTWNKDGIWHTVFGRL